jgi:hypothetical protein
MVPCPPTRKESDRQAEWRLAMAKRHSKIWPQDPVAAEQSRRRERTLNFGKSTVLIRGDAAIFTQTGPLTKEDARNFRSYWSESLITGLVQHDYLDHFQDRLASIGSPVRSEIEPLYRDWLDFRNLIWWSQLAVASEVPQELLFALREARGTDRLFYDLEGDLATYTAQRRSIVENRQAAALANLQVYGSAFAVLGPVLAVIALTGAKGGALAVLVGFALALAAVVAYLVHRQLRPPEELGA